MQENDDTSTETRLEGAEKYRMNTKHYSCEEYYNPWSQDIFDEMNLQPVSL